MRPFRLVISSRTGRISAVTGAALLITGVYESVHAVTPTAAALTYLVLVELVAITWGLSYSVYLSILSVLLYDYFFLPPFRAFTIAEPRNLIAFLAFLITAVVISRLSESERRQIEVSEKQRRELERLYQFSQQLLMKEDLRDLARSSPTIVASTFDMENTAVYVADVDQVFFADPEHEFVSINQLRANAQVSDIPPFPVYGVRILPLSLGMRVSGSIAMTGNTYSDRLYGAVADLLAIAFARAAALERSGRIEAARESERLRSALLDSVTHELRTPLTAVRAAATSLRSQGSLEEVQRSELISVIDEESARLDRLIDQAVEMAQLDTDGIHLRLRKQKLQEVIETALEESRVLLRGREVIVNLPKDMPTVVMDPILIGHVLRHLIENAVKYSPDGSPLNIESKLTGDRLLISVQDQGQGIEEAEQALIFDKFYRGSRQRKQLQGTGMGLAIAKAILRVHNGGIDVISHPHQGSIFTFWIPASGATSPRAAPGS